MPTQTLGSNIHAGIIVTRPEPSSTRTTPPGPVVRYLDSELFARKADAKDSESLLPGRHGQNVWGIVMGRKNYLFMGSDSGDQRAAVLYSLMATAKLNDLDPALYLRTVIARIAELMPWNLAPILEANSPLAA
jgi:hypothetical protein